MDDLANVGPDDGRSVLVLHIEDDEAVARAVARLLHLEGYEVVGAASGDAALGLVDAGLVPDLILSDYHLPRGLTGDQLVCELATRLGYKPPVIMLASLSEHELERLQSVADKTFAKPADMNLVLYEMERLLGTRI